MAVLLAETQVEADLGGLAEALLRGFVLVAGKRRFALREVETYLYADGHRDPFAHRHPHQASTGRWHFHRQGQSYRGGTFKGLDLTFGPSEVRAGLLIRAVSEGDAMVSGPCRVVHALLEATETRGVAELDARLASALDPKTPLHLAPRPPSPLPIYSSARVGLGLAREGRHPTMRAFLARRQRWLDAPHIREGRDLLTVALHEDGVSPTVIAERLRSPLPTVEARLRAWQRGSAGGWSATPGPHETCARLGALYRKAPDGTPLE